MKCLEKKVHSYVTKSLKPSGECAEVQHTLYLTFQLPLVFIVIISCQSHLKASSSYCALKFTWEIVSFLGTHEQKIFLVLAVFILSSYFLDNMVWYRILSLKYYLKEIEMIALLYPIAWCYLWSIDWSLAHLCVINFLCSINFLKRVWNVFLHWDWNYACVDPFSFIPLGNFGSFGFEEPCLAIAWGGNFLLLSIWLTSSIFLSLSLCFWTCFI